MHKLKKIFNLYIMTLMLLLNFNNMSVAKKNNVNLPNIQIGELNYNALNFKRGIYKKTSGPEHCIEGEYRLLKDPKTGRVFLMADEKIFINHIDQKVVNTTDNKCIISYFNVINKDNELESTEIQSCSEPINVSNIRTLKIKFNVDTIEYVFIAKDPTQQSTKKTHCELKKEA